MIFDEGTYSVILALAANEAVGAGVIVRPTGCRRSAIPKINARDEWVVAPRTHLFVPVEIAVQPISHRLS